MVADQSISLLERCTGMYFTNRTWVLSPSIRAPPGPARSPTFGCTSLRLLPEAMASCAETCSPRTASRASSLVSLPSMAVIGWRGTRTSAEVAKDPVGTQVRVSLVPMASATFTVSQVVVGFWCGSSPVAATTVVLAATTAPATKAARSEGMRVVRGMGR